jgi:Tfp pilus assembly protein FimT
MTFPRGSTFIELIMVVALLLVIFSFGGITLSRFQRSTAYIAGDREVINVISMAARRARNGTAGTPWGVYFKYDDTTRTAINLTVFSGNSYATRITNRDLTFDVSNKITFTSVDFSGSGVDVISSHEIIFAPLTGTTTNYGSIVLSWYDATRTLIINSNGLPVRQ